MPEFIRKFFVALKRKPQTIPLVAVTIGFIWYSANLSAITYTISVSQGNNIGLTGFAIMLLSTLAIVCCMNAFPYRKPVHKPMLILLFIMLAIVIFCDYHFISHLSDRLGSNYYPDPETVSKVTGTRGIIITHIVLLGIGTLLVATLPVYSKWIRKIKTSVEVAENADMEVIDISGE